MSGLGALISMNAVRPDVSDLVIEILLKPAGSAQERLGGGFGMGSGRPRAVVSAARFSVKSVAPLVFFVSGAGCLSLRPQFL